MKTVLLLVTSIFTVLHKAEQKCICGMSADFGLVVNSEFRYETGLTELLFMSLTDKHPTKGIHVH